eukprot:scaffold25804_cov58-Attheya_sp.AAC.5
MAEPTVIRLHGNQPFRDQLGHMVHPSLESTDDGASKDCNRLFWSTTLRDFLYTTLAHECDIDTGARLSSL